MDVSTIEARVKRQLNEPTATNAGFWSDTDYLNCINEAQEDFAIRTLCLKTDASFTTAADTAMYDISESSLTNFIDIAQVLYYESDDVYDVLISISRDKLLRYRGTDSVTSVPSFYCYEDRTIEFECDTDADKTVKVFYYYLPTALTLSTSVSGIPTKFHQALVSYVCWKLCESDDTKMDKVMYFKQQYMEEIMQALSVLEPPASSYETITDIDEVPYV